MQKNFETQPAKGQPSAKTMELINRYTQKELSPEDVFVFSVVLCDNEIDRDFERFSKESLEKLAPLFLGKPAIKNHSMDTDDQSARTFQTEVLTDAEKKNSLGEPYCYIKAHCYMPRLSKNAELIAEIGAGIKKEVSVSCAVEHVVCSICGKDSRKEPCSHRRGKVYGDELCYFTLENPTDAYEWSFVAVPAQKNAGVTKSFSLDTLLKKAKQAPQTDGIYLSSQEALALEKAVKDMQGRAQDGAAYAQLLHDRFLKESAKAFPQLKAELRETLCRNLTCAELQETCDALKSARQMAQMPMPQLAKPEDTSPKTQNTAFKF